MNESLTASYRAMQQQEAWHDLLNLMDKIVEDSNKELDVIAVEHLSATVAAHGRGMRDAVKRLRSHMERSLMGNPQ